MVKAAKFQKYALLKSLSIKLLDTDSCTQKKKMPNDRKMVQHYYKVLFFFSLSIVLFYKGLGNFQ